MTERTASAAPLVVRRNPDLLEEILRLCAAASVSPDVVGDPQLTRRSWLTASCVLVGADCAGDVSALQLPRRPDVFLVADPPETAGLWRDAVAIRADQLAVVPEAETWLIGRLTDSIDGAVKAATVGVIGARGGAGASTLAAALGLTASRRGNTALLVDLDGLGGGIELVVGCESVPGLRWPDVAATKGRVSAAALRSALPSDDGLAVLSWGRADDPELDSATLRSVLSSGQRGSDLVILDLPRHLDARARDALRTVDTLLLVCTADLRSTAGGGRLLRSLNALCADIRLVVRRRRGDDLLVDALASTLGLPLAATIPTQRGIKGAIDEGLGPLCRGGIARPCARLLDDLGVRSPVTR
ncbi:MAG: septum site-determining protein [Propionibacteriales bacterium]|nr:septum site-determining protein [Propionibacteriales bacterium]